MTLGRVAVLQDSVLSQKKQLLAELKAQEEAMEPYCRTPSPTPIVVVAVVRSLCWCGRCRLKIASVATLAQAEAIARE